MIQLARLLESTDQSRAVRPTGSSGEGMWPGRLSDSGFRSGHGPKRTMMHPTGELPFHSGEIGRGTGEDVVGRVPAGKATTTSRWVYVE